MLSALFMAAWELPHRTTKASLGDGGGEQSLGGFGACWRETVARRRTMADTGKKLSIITLQLVHYALAFLLIIEVIDTIANGGSWWPIAALFWP